ncbi:hypothetical protein ZIOFF_074669 [Zingiber officinale]|uniref:DUF7722 domain-containing protein n=1 Tax=Zingiber officinale TaxID=94328 RepID=A0A8J5CQX7_ZINOF|nr:hypothetical protein ZIOFF_074669 [Zingiber officinale]
MGSLGPSMGMGMTKVIPTANKLQQKQLEQRGSSCFQMPLHYPRYTRADYETMPEWKLNCLLQEYGLPATGGVDDKRKFAMGTFLWS